MLVTLQLPVVILATSATSLNVRLYVSAPQVLRLCNTFAPRGIDPVRLWLQQRQKPVLAAVSVRRGAAGFGIVMSDAAIVCGGAGHTCEAIPLGATVVQVGATLVKDKADVVACISKVPAGAEVQFAYRHTAPAAAQEAQLHGVVLALRAAEMPPSTWVTELSGTWHCSLPPFLLCFGGRHSGQV